MNTHVAPPVKSRITRQLEILALRAVELGDRVAGGELKFLDAVDVAYEAALWSQLANRVDTDPLVGDIIEHWLKHATGLKTIVFAVNVAHSQHIASEFNKAGIKAEHLDGSTPKTARDAILGRLASGETQVVVNCNVLTEGFDLPDVGCLVLARPTKQQGLYRQMVGRGLRPASGKTALVVLDHSGAIYRHGCVEDAIEWTLEPDKRAANPAHAGRPVRDTDGSYQSRIVDCKGCGAKRLSGEVCRHCGYYPKPAAEAIVFQNGNLALYSRTTKQVKPASDPNEQQRWHAMLAYLTRSRGPATWKRWFASVKQSIGKEPASSGAWSNGYAPPVSSSMWMFC